MRMSGRVSHARPYTAEEPLAQEINNNMQSADGIYRYGVDRHDQRKCSLQGAGRDAPVRGERPEKARRLSDTLLVVAG